MGWVILFRVGNAYLFQVSVGEDLKDGLCSGPSAVHTYTSGGREYDRFIEERVSETMKPQLRVEGGGGTGGPLWPILGPVTAVTMPPETLQRPPAPLPLRIYTNPFIEEHPSGTIIVKRGHFQQRRLYSATNASQASIMVSIRAIWDILDTFVWLHQTWPNFYQ